MLMCEVCLGHHVLTVAFNWMETTVNSLLVGRVMTHSLNSPQLQLGGQCPTLVNCCAKCHATPWPRCPTLAEVPHPGRGATPCSPAPWSCLNVPQMLLAAPSPCLVGSWGLPDPHGALSCWWCVPEPRNPPAQCHHTVTSRLASVAAAATAATPPTDRKFSADINLERMEYQNDYILVIPHSIFQHHCMAGTGVIFF